MKRFLNIAGVVMVILIILGGAAGAVYWGSVGIKPLAAFSAMLSFITFYAGLCWCGSGFEKEEREKQYREAPRSGGTPMDERRVLPLLTYAEANIIPPRDSLVSPPS